MDFGQSWLRADRGKWSPYPCALVSRSGYEQWQVWMPSDADHLVIVVERLDNLQLLRVLRIRYHNALVEAGTGHKVAIRGV